MLFLFKFTVNKCQTQPSTDANAPAPTVTLPASLGTMHTYTCNSNYVVAVGNNDYVKICGAKTGSNYEAEWKHQTGEPANAACVGRCTCFTSVMNPNLLFLIG